MWSGITSIINNFLEGNVVSKDNMDFDKKTIDILNEKGCKLALTIKAGVANISKESRFLLPRIDTINIPINYDS